MDADKYISEDTGFSSHLVLDNVSTEHNHDFYEIIYIVSGKIEHTIENVKSILQFPKLSVFLGVLKKEISLFCIVALYLWNN